MFDILATILWSITYVLIIVAGFLGWNDKKVSIPYISVVLNFSWEFVALLNSKGFYGHILWFGLDCFIVYLEFHFLNALKIKCIYAISFLVTVGMYVFIFNYPNGMLISSFAIDLIMSICFCLWYRNISDKFKTTIAATKLLGDIFAGIYYASQGTFVAVAAILAFIFNLYYLSLCLEEKK